MHPFSLLAVVALACTATAQFTAVIPNGTATVEGTSSTSYPWGRGNGPVRVQYIYDASHFTNQGLTYPIYITNLRWRANGGGTTAGYLYNNATVQLSTAAVDYLTPSATFASNHGPDLQTVYTGPITVATPSGTTPNDWLVDLPITAFVYDPSTGADLCFDISHDGVGPTTTSGPAIDCETTTALATRIYDLTNPAAATGTIQPNIGIVCELGYSPASGLFPTFAGAPLAGPIGTTVQFTDHSYTSDPNGISAWFWDLDGDGVTDSTAQNPSFQYAVGGLFDVTLTVVDGTHGAQTLTKPQYVAIDAVTASFTGNVLAGTFVQFTDTSVGNPTSWAWDFNADGVIDSTAQNPIYQFPAQGAYSVSLTATNAFSTDTAVVSIGVGILAMPPFGSTYTATTATRGVWFQAPTRFSITSLKVPDESNHGLQNVAVYRLVSPPPNFSASATGGLAFLSTGLPSSQTIPCALSFDAGEYVGILAACGDATTMRTSYAQSTGTFASSVFGQPVTLTRLLTQTNLVTTQGTAPYSSEVGGNIGRVDVGISACVGIPYGLGSPSSSALAPELATTALPFVGQTAQLTLTNHDAQAIGLIAVGVGRLAVPTPFGTLLIANIAGTATLNGGALMTPGQYTFSFAIPNNPALQGFGPVNWQAASLVVPSGEFAMSNANEWWLSL